MNDVFTPDAAQTEYRRERARRPNPRPDRFALWAVVMAVVAMFAGVATADAGSGGGIGTGGGSGDGSKAAGHERYDRIWNGYGQKKKRWARKTSKCESGMNPKAIGGGGAYRGAFQFTKPTWRTAPKSPGGDPIRYAWRTQAVVAVELKRRDGAHHWPNCG